MNEFVMLNPNLKGLLILLLFVCFIKASLDSSQIVVIIISQNNLFNSRLATALKDDIFRQAEKHELKIPIVKIIPQDVDHIGAWTIVPILPRLKELFGSNSTWLYFCEDTTVVSLSNLIHHLSQLQPEEVDWAGHALRDKEPTIIHHFAFADNPQRFKYPLFTAGFVISMNFINRIFNGERDTEEDIGSDFSIDAGHELALYLGSELTDLSDAFCLKSKPSCASYPLPPTHCGSPLSKDEIFIAVKTCHKFHQDRIPIVMKTWGKQAKYIEFFSDIQNASIPTTSVGIKNTERGHCSKTLEIIRMFLKRSKSLPSVRWLLLADDDTIISIPRLLSLLACYEEDTVLGERYGFNVKHPVSSGYNYITGGGGIVFGIQVVEKVATMCHCPSADAPDDMLLGACLTAYGIPMTHSSLFHQARPVDYAAPLLDTQTPVSFHKHWIIDPISVYNKWFSHLDLQPRDEL